MNRLIMNGTRMKSDKIDLYNKRFCRMIKIGSRYSISKRIRGVSYFSIMVKPHFPKYEAQKIRDVNRCVNSLSYQSYQCIPNTFGILRVL